MPEGFLEEGPAAGSQGSGRATSPKCLLPPGVRQPPLSTPPSPACLSLVSAELYQLGEEMGCFKR